MSGTVIKRCTSIDEPGWLSLRMALWPKCSAEEHLAEMATFIAQPDKFVQFVACSEEGQLTGFAEASIRSEYVNGVDNLPVAFLEGLYVITQARRKGIGAALVDAVAAWASEVGCCELASDALLDNQLSHTVHKALGFVETERVVYFRKKLK